MRTVEKYKNSKTSMLLYRIAEYIREKYDDLFIRNPFEDDDFYDLVKAVGITSDYELVSFRGFYIKTTHPERVKLGVAEKYFWYRRRQILRDMANIIFCYMYLNYNVPLYNDPRLPNYVDGRKLKRLVRKTIRKLKFSRKEIRDVHIDVKKNKIIRMSN